MTESVIFVERTLTSRNKKVLLALTSIIVVFLLWFFYRSNASTTSQIYSMNTIIDIEVSGMNRQEIVSQITEEINNLNGLFDDFNPKSDISLINNKAGIISVKVSPDTIDILEKSKEMYTKTYGKFNVMVGPLMELWGFKTGDYRVPSKEQIDEVLKLTDINDLIIDKTNLTVFLKKKGERLDLGGIAKGYTLDKVYAILKENNAKKAIINMGGNVLVYSENSKETFNVGIKHPRADGIIAVLKVKSGTFIATSGDYERYFEENGKRYCHIIDPLTGYPADFLTSATAVTNEGYLGDVLSTAFFILGEEKSLVFAKDLAVGSVTVDGNLNIHYSTDLSGVITIENRG